MSTCGYKRSNGLFVKGQRFVGDHLEFMQKLDSISGQILAHPWIKKEVMVGGILNYIAMNQGHLNDFLIYFCSSEYT